MELDLEELLAIADDLEKADQSSASKDDSASGGRGSNDASGAPSDGDAGEFNSQEVELLSLVGSALSDVMSSELSDVDLDGRLSDEEHQEIMFIIFDKVLKALKMKGSERLDADDYAFIKKRIHLEAAKRGVLQHSAPQRRFALLERVVCHVGGDRGWAAGTVQALDQENDELDPYKVFPYAVKIDPPEGFLFFAPSDTNEHVRAEVCFGRRADSHVWTLRCLPRAKRRGAAGQTRARFRVGERVVCAVEAMDDNYTDWAAGTVAAVDHPIEGAEGVTPGGRVPYQVALDDGSTVLVHADEHWLLRDLNLQPAGARVAADGTRTLARMGKRKLGDEWQTVDHVTRNVRKLVQEDSDSSDADD